MSKNWNRMRRLGIFKGGNSNDEISSLKAQLEDERANVEKLFKEQEVENAKKEDAMKELSSKFRRLQRNLIRADKERKFAVSSKERAEKENVHLRKLLQIRDKELQALNLHIAVSENSSKASIDEADGEMQILKKMIVPDSIDIPSVNVSIPDHQVTKMMTNLELQLSIRDEHVDNLNNEMKELKSKMQDSLALERMLRESKGDQQLTKAQLERLERDYDEIMRAVSQCCETMKAMSVSFQRKEKEKNQILWEANRCITQQRAMHLKNCQNMAKELYDMQVRVEELEARHEQQQQFHDPLEGDTSDKKAIPLEQLVVNNSRMAAFAYKELAHQREISRITKEADERIAEVHELYSEHIDGLHSTLLEKEKEIYSLREDLSKNMDRMMQMSSELSRIRERTPLNMEIENSPYLGRDEITFSDTYDSELEMDKSFFDFEERSSSSAQKQKRSLTARALFSGSVIDDASVMLETRSLQPLQEEDALDITMDEGLQSELDTLRVDNTRMIVKLSELSEKIQALERQIEIEQATISLLNTNLDMMESAMQQKDEKIRSLTSDVRQQEERLFVLSKSNPDVDATEDSELTKVHDLEIELAILKDKLKTESEIMQSMIQVLNDQLYQAMKALEDEKMRDRMGGISSQQRSMPSEDERVAILEQELRSLHRKFQSALQLSQAEVAALRSKLDIRGRTANDPFTFTLDWLTPQKPRSPYETPPSTPMR